MVEGFMFCAPFTFRFLFFILPDYQV